MHDDGLRTRLAGRLATGALALACTLAPAAARAESSNQLAVQAGWWSAELEFDAFFGAYAAAGLAWGQSVLDSMGDEKTQLHAEAALGYRHRFDNGLELGGGVRAVTPCPSGHCDMQLFELGLRYVDPSGMVMGLNLPLVTVYSDMMPFGFWPFPFSLLASQFCFGIAWDL